MTAINYVKWDYELRRPDQVGEVIARGFQIAASDPPGPVYLTLPRENLMERIGAVDLYPPERFPPAKIGAGDPDALCEAARLLVASERPVVLTGKTGRSAAGYRGLVRLAELLALPVVEWRERTNFPTDHPLHQGSDPGPLLERADPVLILDQDVPYIPTRSQPAPNATVIQIDLDPIKERIPLWTFPLSLPIRADTGRALDLIADEAAKWLDDAARARVAARQQECTARHQELRESWEKAAREASERQPIDPVWLSHCLGQLAREAPECVFVDETVTNNRVLWRYLPGSEPDGIYGSGGSALGWGLGAALGVKLARPERPVIAVVGDGSFVFGAPLVALWAAQTQGAPILVVIYDNGCYNATRSPLVAAYPDGASVQTDNFVGIDLLPSPRYDLFAAVVGAHGERVEEPAEVRPGLRRGLDRVRSGQSAIVDVRLAYPS